MFHITYSWWSVQKLGLWQYFLCPIVMAQFSIDSVEYTVPRIFSFPFGTLHYISFTSLYTVCCLYYGLPWASSRFYLGVSDLPSWAWWACWIFLLRTDHFVCGFLIQMGNTFMQVYVLYTRAQILNSCFVWFFPLTCFSLFHSIV